MGIVDRELEDFALQGEAGEMELSVGNEVHLHFGGLRISITAAQFLDMADLLEESMRKLDALKGIGGHG